MCDCFEYSNGDRAYHFQPDDSRTLCRQEVYVGAGAIGVVCQLLTSLGCRGASTIDSAWMTSKAD